MTSALYRGTASGSTNMVRDNAMLESFHAQDKPYVIQTYTWSPWCVSLGKHQPLTVVDETAMRAAGFDVVHRPTGGRAVLHAEELTYCIVAPLIDGRTPQLIYAAMHRYIVQALELLNIHDLVFQDVPTDLRSHYASSGASGASCFTSSARSEIMAHGRKVVGSAQRVINGMVLQHGSILCGSGHERLAEVLAIDDAARSELRARLLDSATTLSALAGRIITPLDCAEALAHISTPVFEFV